MKAPGSPSSPLQTMYLTGSSVCAATCAHFAPGREARAAAAAQTGIAHGLHDLVRLHLEQGLGQRAVAADGQVLLDGFRVDVAAVLEHAAGLTACKTGYPPAAHRARRPRL